MSSAQLDLFGTKELRELRAENEWLRARLETAKDEYRRLRAGRDKLRADYYDLNEVCTELGRAHEALIAERNRLRIAISILENEAQTWKLLYESRKDVPGKAPSAPMKGELTKLLALCHPDKWSQGQPATELAHEVSVALNAWRDRLGVA